MSQPVRDAAFWKRFSEEMHAFHAEQDARFLAAGQRRRALLATLRMQENHVHPVRIRWSSAGFGTPTSTSGSAGVVVPVAARPDGCARGKGTRRRWHWF